MPNHLMNKLKIMRSSLWQKGTFESLKINKQCIKSLNIQVCRALTSKNSNLEWQWYDITRREVLDSILIAICIPCCNLDNSRLFVIFLDHHTYMGVRIYASSPYCWCTVGGLFLRTNSISKIHWIIDGKRDGIVKYGNPNWLDNWILMEILIWWIE